MRKKEKRLIAAFYSTHDAMAFEAFCHSHGADGRLIPLPKDISAGCGLAWSTSCEEEQHLKELLAEAGIRAQHIKVLEI